MMMTRKNKMGPIVEIVIKGDVGAGKSTLCQLIQKALKEENITNVTVDDETRGNMPSMAFFQSRTKALREKNAEIRIRTEQLAREERQKRCGESFGEFLMAIFFSKYLSASV